MSVAFRRDSDEEHKEPRFELPLPPGPNLLTAHGLTKIEDRVRQLQEQVAGEADETASEALKRELRYWETRRSTAQVAPEAAGDQVAIGTQVTIRLNGVERAISIVGHDEADPAAGMISFAAPLAAALLGAGVGEQLPFAGKEDAVEIVAIGIIPV